MLRHGVSEREPGLVSVSSSQGSLSSGECTGLRHISCTSQAGAARSCGRSVFEASDAVQRAMKVCVLKMLV